MDTQSLNESQFCGGVELGLDRRETGQCYPIDELDTATLGARERQGETKLSSLATGPRRRLSQAARLAGAAGL